MSRKRKKKKVVVLGAGLAGLACADELLEKGQDGPEVLILEKEAHVGGLAATFKKDGFLFDLAPHRWFTKNEELNLWVAKLMKKEMVWVNKNTPMYQFGKFFKYPVEIMDILKKISPFKTLLMLVTYLWARFSRLISRKKIINMKEAYVSRFGLALYRWFNEEYNQKIWGDTEKMSADWVEQRTKDLSLSTIVKEALGFEKKVISLTPRFQFPKRGIGQISLSLAKRIKKNKGEIRKGVSIKKIIKTRFGYQVATDQGVFEADDLVSSIPLDELVRLLKPQPPASVLKRVKNLTYVHQKIVVLFAAKTRLTPFTWVYVHPLKIKSFRFLETNNWSKEMSPEGKTSLVFEYPYQANDEIEKMGDRALIELTIRDFIKYFSPGIKKTEILKGRVFLVPKAYPKYELGYQAALEPIKDYLGQNHPRLQLIGRNGRFRYNNMDHSIFTGLLAARNIIQGRNIYDLDRVNNKAEYLEEKRLS